MPPSIRVEYGGHLRRAAEIVPRISRGSRRRHHAWSSWCCCLSSGQLRRAARDPYPRRLLVDLRVFLALLVTGMTFNIASFMGLIMVVGIVAKNGILLLDADQIPRGWIPPEDTMIQAGHRRLRPIMMTAMATVAGMFPLALAVGAGSQMLQPLAIAVIGGILASMVLSLVVTPAVRFYVGRD